MAMKEKEKIDLITQISLDINEVKEGVEGNFPSLWFYIEACLAAVATLLINDIKDPASLVLLGSSSCGKGTTLSVFKSCPLTYWSDDFTAQAFLPLTANLSEDELRKIDLIRKIKDKTLIVPELAPIFQERADKLRKTIAILTRVFDGEGLRRDGGTHPQRMFSGECRFTLLAATTPPHEGLWKILGKLGNRLCFIHFPDSRSYSTTEDFIEAYLVETAYKDKIEAVRGIVNSYLTELFNAERLEWDRSNDPRELLMKIAQLAELSGRLRGLIPSNRLHNGTYDRGFPEIEQPERFTTLLINLARGRALIHGRRNIDNSDLELVKKVALSSCYEGRYRLIQYLIENEGEAVTEEVEDLLGCAKSTALSLIEDLTILGVVERVREPIHGGGRVIIIRLKEPYLSLLSLQYSDSHQVTSLLENTQLPQIM